MCVTVVDSESLRAFWCDKATRTVYRHGAPLPKTYNRTTAKIRYTPSRYERVLTGALAGATRIP